MRKRKFHIILVICVAFFISLFTSVSASNYNIQLSELVSPATDETENGMTVEESLAVMMEQIGNLQKQMINLQNSMLMIWESLAGEPADNEVTERQIEQSFIAERHLTQLRYYNACLLEVKSDLLKRGLILSERQFRAESVRMTLGLSTQIRVDTMNAQLSDIRKQIELCNETKLTSRQFVESKRNVSRYEFIKNYEVPELPVFKVKTFEEVKKELLKNNATLYVYDDQMKKLNNTLSDMKQSDAYKSSRDTIQSQIDTLDAQRALHRRQLEMAAERKWAAYLDAQAEYDIAVLKRPSLLAQLNSLDVMLRLGLISEIEMLEKQTGVYGELKKEDIALIALVVAVTELDIALKGVTV